ncbi:MAG: hypothetical protein KGV43_01860 [Arcobacter sp.]|nr:hypothetical protein [Arcobacter sp.]
MTLFNPSVSLLCAFFYSLVVSFTDFNYIYVLPIIYILFLNRAYIFFILKKLFALNLFIFLLFLTLLINSEFNDALNIYLRTNAILLFNISIFYSSSGYDIIRGLNILKLPKNFISSMYFTIKMIEYLNDDFKNILNTLKTRGFKAKNSLFTYETFGNIIGMLFIRSIKKAESLKNTFLSRGFLGDIYLINNYKTSKNDYFLIVLVLLVFLYKVCL